MLGSAFELAVSLCVLQAVINTSTTQRVRNPFFTFGTPIAERPSSYIIGARPITRISSSACLTPIADK